MKENAIYGKKADGAPITSQREAVLEYLRDGNVLTQRDATRMWSATRLPSIINLLRRQLVKEGGKYRIITRDVTAKNRFGVTCRHGEYRLEKVNPGTEKKVEE